MGNGNTNGISYRKCRYMNIDTETQSHRLVYFDRFIVINYGDNTAALYRNLLSIEIKQPTHRISIY